MVRRFGLTVAALAALCVSRAPQSGAQTPDTLGRFSIFGGAVRSDNPEAPNGTRTSKEFGASADFQVRVLPVSLRSSLAIGQDENDATLTPVRMARLSLDVIGKSLPSRFGLQPFLLGGVGLATRSEFTVPIPSYASNSAAPAPVLSVPRRTWAFAEAGVGVDVGRHLFVQTKLVMPLASQGTAFIPVSFGFRF
jgi:hypothetical protein